MTNRLQDKNEMYITREETYNAVIDDLLKKKKDNSTHPLAVVDDKINDEDDLLLNGIDIQDREQQKIISQKRELQKKNAQLMDGQFTGSRIRELTNNLEEVKKQIGEAEGFIGQRLRAKRNQILDFLDIRLKEIKEEMAEQDKRKKADQYDFKEREKELNEHLETMTQVA